MANKKKKAATEAGLGHNSAGTNESKERLRQYIKRIEKLEEAQARLKKMTTQRDALVVAISAYKKYVQKLIGQL